MDAAQAIADGFDPRRLHRRLDEAVKRFVPTLTTIDGGIQWGTAEIEYSTDIIFERPEVLKPVYEEVVRTLAHAVKPDQISMFLGKRLSPRFEGEMGTGFVRRIEGMCLRHFMASSGIKIYDKYGRILRIECFTNKVGSFTHCRNVDHRDGTRSFTKAAVCKTIYRSCAQIGRIIKRLRMHGLVKKAPRSFKYYLTALGKRVAATALKLKEMFVIPSLRGHLATT